MSASSQQERQEALPSEGGVVQVPSRHGPTSVQPALFISRAEAAAWGGGIDAAYGRSYVLVQDRVPALLLMTDFQSHASDSLLSLVRSASLDSEVLALKWKSFTPMELEAVTIELSRRAAALLRGSATMLNVLLRGYVLHVDQYFTPNWIDQRFGALHVVAATPASLPVAGIVVASTAISIIVPEAAEPFVPARPSSSPLFGLSLPPLSLGMGLLITGPSGVGKSSLLLSATIPDAPCLLVKDTNLEIIRRINGGFKGLVLIDDVHFLAPRRSQVEAEKRFGALLARALSSARRMRRICVVATASDKNAVAVPLLGSCVLDCEIRLSTPNLAVREQVLCCWLRPSLAHLAHAAAVVSAGLATADIAGIAKQAMHESQLMELISVARPASVKGLDSLHSLPPVVGGMHRALGLLDMLLLNPLRQGQVPSGLLLYGPEGNGKTLLARHIGHVCEAQGLATFVPVRSVNLISKVVGETEANISNLFRRAREASPCILFLDEADVLMPHRGGDEDSTEGTFDRIVSLLLVELDGIVRTNGVCLLAATQRPEAMDPAMLRPGRLGHKVFVGPPEDSDEVALVLVACLSQTPLAGNRSEVLQRLAKRGNGRSRAELADWVRRAVLVAVEKGAPAVEEEDFDEGLEEKEDL